jgi:hypothetical protein
MARLMQCDAMRYTMIPLVVFSSLVRELVLWRTIVVVGRCRDLGGSRRKEGW